MTDEEQCRAELGSFFRKLSADRWSAGWAQDIEFHTWEEMLGLGGDQFLDYELNHLCELARYASGWFYFREDHGAAFISMLDWLDMYREWKAAKCGY